MVDTQWLYEGEENSCSGREVYNALNYYNCIFIVYISDISTTIIYKHKHYFPL